MSSAVQPWLSDISMMKQSVLFTCIRGNDGSIKHDGSKPIVRWLRRCILVSAFDKDIIKNPWDPRGGSFTGPSCKVPSHSNYFPEDSETFEWELSMESVVDEYLKSVDSLHFHFQMHILHGAEVLGYEHPDERIRNWWFKFYERLVSELHLNVETKEQFDYRLGDSLEQWDRVADKSTR